MEERSERGRQARPDQRGKRMYEPPEIRSQEIFETTALACGKVNTSQPGCMVNTKTS